MGFVFVMLGKEVLIFWGLLSITICLARPNTFDLRSENRNVEKIEVNADVNVWLNDYLLHQIQICNFYKDLLEKRGGDKRKETKNREGTQIYGRVIKKRMTEDQKLKMKKPNPITDEHIGTVQQWGPPQ